MSGLITALVTGVTWCFCTATASLFSSWCGNDKPSTIPPSATSGRKRSVFLLAFSVVVALIFQYAVAPHLQPDLLAADAPYIGEYLVNAWTAGCANDNPELVQVCSGNAGAYRASSAAFAFFILFGTAAKCRATSNREVWPAKYVLYVFLCVGTVFISNDPLFVPIYLNVARAGGAIFVLFQQLILVDVAYNWNESWVGKADQADIDEGQGNGKKWLAAILVSCGILYVGSFVGIILMYIYFGGCGTNEAFISITLVMSVVCTAIQLTISETGSLLTSASISAYSTYLCGTAISKNPNAECNPKIGESSTWDIVVGLLLALISLMWTGWSSTADKHMGKQNGDEGEQEEGDGGYSRNEGEGDDQKVRGVVINNPTYGAAESAVTKSGAENSVNFSSTSFGDSWKLNVVLALVCCWYSMALTGWGTIESRGDIANPDVSKVSMWMLISSQWVALFLYLWTLVAPSLFPNRDFS